VSEPEWIAWRIWAVTGVGRESRLVSPFCSGGEWVPGQVFESAGARLAHPSDAGVYGWLRGSRPLPANVAFPYVGGRGLEGRIVLGRARFWGRMRSIAGQLCCDYCEVVSLDRVMCGRVDLSSLRALYTPKPPRKKGRRARRTERLLIEAQA
jgi:hypothetical protein